MSPTAVETPAALALRDVVHLYPSIEGDVVALKGVDLDVAPGSSVALLGPSGAGKSTVLALLSGEFVASAGSVTIDGEDIGRMDPERLSALRALDMSLVRQGAERNLIPYASASDNLWFAQQGARRRGRSLRYAPAELLDLFGLSEVADTPVSSLPSGLRQRVALAAGVAPLPRALLLDEPTSRLDPQSRDEVVGMVLRIGEELGATIVAVTHDPDVAASLGRTVTIRDGRVGSVGHRGVEYAVVGRDGSVQLPPDVLAFLPPDTMVEVMAYPLRHTVELRRRGEDES